jgi:alpha-tubulin suppressor-like RCC1 family protein
MTTQVTSNNITNNSITASSLASGLVSPKITSVAITDSSYNVLDDTAANTTGGYIQISGSNFTSTSQVVIGTNNATSVTYVNSAIIRAQVPAAAATSYPVYVIDTTTGATAIKINGLTQSSFPAWGTAATLANTAANTVFSVSLSANSDSNITYSNTSALPAGTSLLSNGYFYGTVTIGQQTTYSFDVKATDAELQDATRTFSMTVTVTPAIRLYAWGGGGIGQLAQNDTVYRSSPVQVGTETTWSSQFACGWGGAAIKNDGTLWTWGQNNFGQLGKNDTVYRSSPVQVGSGTTWSKISIGMSNRMVAIKTDGTMWTWGRDYNGSTGLNTPNIHRSSPTQIGADTNWSSVNAGFDITFAVRTDGTLWVWGYANQYGEFGTNNISSTGRSSPTQVGASTNWAEAISAETWSIGRRTDGTLWSWGHGSSVNGALGLNETVDRSSPTQIGTGTTWSSFTYGDNGGTSVLAVKTDGTLWAWGSDGSGQAGKNSTGTNRSSPTQVGFDTNWLKADLIYKDAVIAIKTNGTLWSWGNNNHGRLGLNDKVFRSSPTQVGAGTSWTYISGGDRTGFAATSN